MFIDECDGKKNGELEKCLVKHKMGDELWIQIDGDVMEVSSVNDAPFRSGDVGVIEADSNEFYVATDAESAGAEARAYWEDMAHNDPSEFAELVGKDTLVSWALGQHAGPGSETAQSLDDWLDIVADHPEEELGRYDGNELDVDYVPESVQDELGFKPTVAYRSN